MRGNVPRLASRSPKPTVVGSISTLRAILANKIILNIMTKQKEIKQRIQELKPFVHLTRDLTERRKIQWYLDRYEKNLLKYFDICKKRI